MNAVIVLSACRDPQFCAEFALDIRNLDIDQLRDFAVRTVCKADDCKPADGNERDPNFARDRGEWSGICGAC